MRRINDFLLPSFAPFLMLILPLHRSKLLAFFFFIILPKDLLLTFLKADLLAINSLSLYFVFICIERFYFSTFEIKFHRLWISWLAFWVFPPQILNTSLYSLLAYMASDKKSAIILILILLEVRCFFP